MDQEISSGEPPRFVVCLRNDGWPVCLEVRKVYRVLPDEPGRRVGWIRIVDETDEDYLYPAEYFHPLDLPSEIARALADAVCGEGQFREEVAGDPPSTIVHLGRPRDSD